jgi:hypothetical protein
VLLSDKQRFCPSCYEDDTRAGRDCYGRLLWNIEAVKACPLHRLQLVNRSKTKRSPISNERDGAPSHEGEANRRLTESAGHMSASDYEVESSRLIAELLDDAVVFSDAGYSASAQSAFLTHAIDVLFHGRSAYFAAHLGVSKSQMHGWAKGRVRMSLPRLSLTAYCCCAIADILLGNRVMLSLRPAPHCQRRRLIKRGGRGAWRSKDDLCAELDTLIRSSGARNATEAAQSVGLSLKYLRKNFPDQHAFLVGHGREVFASLRSQATETFDQIYLSEHNALCEEGVYPSRRRVVERMQGKVRIGRRQEVQSAQRKAHAQTGVKIAPPSCGRMAARPSSGRQEKRV